MLWGTSSGGAPISTLEQAIGRTFDIVYYFHGIDTPDLPTRSEKAEVASGRTLHIDLESRQFSLAGHPEVRWTDVSAGAFDNQLRSTAKGLAALHAPFFITFDHEADAPAKLAARGTPAQFVAAWHHVHTIFAQAGATGAIWTWVMTGFATNFHSVAALYPGDSSVDWISWDPYDMRGCQSGGVGSGAAQTFAEVTTPFYHWLETAGVKAGISLGKPYMISETGSAYDPGDPQAGAAFYRSIPAGLAALPRIRAVTLWDQTAGSCSYRVEGVPSVTAALRDAAQLLRRSRE